MQKSVFGYWLRPGIDFVSLTVAFGDLNVCQPEFDFFFLVNMTNINYTSITRHQFHLSKIKEDENV